MNKKINKSVLSGLIKDLARINCVSEKSVREDMENAIRQVNWSKYMPDNPNPSLLEGMNYILDKTQNDVN